MKRKSIILKSLLVLVLLLFCLSGLSFGSPVTYQIMETELIELEQNYLAQEKHLTQALTLLTTQNVESIELRRQLEIALIELRQSKKEIQILRTELRKASDSIEKANQLLDRFEKEERRTQERLRRQRTTWAAFAVSLAIFAASR